MNADSDFLLRQLSNGKDLCNSSNRWCKKVPERSLHQMEGLNLSSDNGLSLKKRVMVVVDHSTRAKHAMMWALTHVANKGDLLTLLHIIPPHKGQSKHFSASSSHLAHSLGSLCTACKPEVCLYSEIQKKKKTNPITHVLPDECFLVWICISSRWVSCLLWGFFWYQTK